jgi:hypothetical protein
VTSYLHPTDTRLNLHAEVVAGRVFQDAIGDSYVSGGRKVTGAIAELEAAGWVSLGDPVDGLRPWRSTPYGDAIRAVRLFDFGREAVLQLMAEAAASPPRVLGWVEIVLALRQRGRRRWQVTVGGTVEILDTRHGAAARLRHLTCLALAAKAVQPR